MRKYNATARRYLREVKSWLPCGGKLKSSIMERIEATVAEYLAQNPGADDTALVARFGTPQQIASTYVDEMETTELLNDLRIRKRIVTIVLVLAVFIGTLWLGTVIVAIANHYIAMNGFFAEEIVEGTAVLLE